MRKRIVVLYLFVLIVLMNCATTENGNETDLSLNEAIEQSAVKLTSELPAGTRVAIAAFDSEHQNLSNYIMDELSGALTGSSLEVTDRRNLDFVYKELGFQMSGDVSDETVVSMGKFWGAQYVITGQFLKTGNNYRYRVSGINVETAVQESSSRLDIRNNRNFQNLLADLRNAKYAAPATYSHPTALPRTAGAFLDRGILHAVRGDYELAIVEFTEAINLDANFAAAWLLRGRAYSASVSDITDILEDFQDFVALVPMGGITTSQKEGYAKAIADYTKAISIDPNLASAYRDRGVAYSYSGNYDKALDDFNMAIRLNPNDPAAYRERGNVYGSRGDDERALADYNRAINVAPNNAWAYINRGNCYLDKGDFDRAIADYNQALKLDPDNATAYNNRGTCYLDKGDFIVALINYDQAIKLDPNYASAYSNRGTCYLNQRDFDHAIAEISQAIKLDPNYASDYNKRGVAYLNKGNFNSAIMDFEVALRIDPNYTHAKDNIQLVRKLRGW